MMLLSPPLHTPYLSHLQYGTAGVREVHGGVALALRLQGASVAVVAMVSTLFPFRAIEQDRRQTAEHAWDVPAADRAERGHLFVVFGYGKEPLVSYGIPRDSPRAHVHPRDACSKGGVERREAGHL